MMFKPFNLRSIMMPTDFSDTANIALDHAVGMAKRHNARLTLVHVFETGSYSGIFSNGHSPEGHLMAEVRARLEGDAVRIAAQHQIKVDVVLGTGRIYDQIVSTAQELETDLIVMGTHGLRGWAEFFVGSNAFKVVTQSPCPVISIPESSKTADYKHIILPLDSTPESRQKVRIAVAIAKMCGASIHIASLITDDAPEVRFDFDKKVKQIVTYLEKEGIQHSENVLVGSNLATMTMNFGESKGGDLIVMMTEQEPNLTGFLMGPYAQQIVNHSRIPVLSIAPEEGEGFHLT